MSIKNKTKKYSKALAGARTPFKRFRGMIRSNKPLWNKNSE